MFFKPRLQEKVTKKYSYTICHSVQFPCTMGRDGVISLELFQWSYFMVLAMESLIRLESHVLPFSLEGQMYQNCVWFQETSTVS